MPRHPRNLCECMQTKCCSCHKEGVGPEMARLGKRGSARMPTGIAELPKSGLRITAARSERSRIASRPVNASQYGDYEVRPTGRHVP